jgi:hypothetical protein
LAVKPTKWWLRSNLNGAPGRIRTADHLVRSQVLYPAELRAPARSVAFAGHFGNSVSHGV